jgi:murein DD-endopeptidase MepM/ murein hydrolase activator NlpD
MSQDDPTGEDTFAGREPSQNQAEPVLSKEPSPEEAKQNRFLSFWESLTRAGLAEVTIRLGTHTLLIALILILAWAMRQFYLYARVDLPRSPALASSLPTPTPTAVAPELPPFESDLADLGVLRMAMITTTIPTRPRVDVIKYTVQKGDTLFGIAEKFGLQPQTLLWGNQYILGDNPHNLRPGQELNILPLDGTYYRWQAGDGLNGVAKFFGVQPEDIVNFPGNQLNPDAIGDYASPNIAAGTWLVIPGGHREFVSWSAPAIPRSDTKVASVLGPGACSGAVDGPIGVAVFIWPSNHHYLSGYNYSPATNHFGIDIDGDLGDAVYAVDNGVVVYAGWNNWGYGNMVVINHGDGWQTLYAHLSAYNVYCGEGVWQGTVIGAIGSTGNSSGPHLHFEMMYNGTKVNPWDYLP